MVQLNIDLAQLPVLSDTKFSVDGKRLVAGRVIVNTPTAIASGGLRLIWATTIAKRSVGKNDKVGWGRGKIVECIEVIVLDETQVIPAGTNEYDFVVRIPIDILETRTSYFDRVRHTLYAGIVESSPTYNQVEVASSSTFSRRSVMKALRKATPISKSSSPPSEADSELFAGLPVIAACSTHVPVFRTHCSEEHDPSYRSTYSGVIPNLGAKFRTQVQSSNLALGGVLEMDVKLQDLPSNSTLHAVKLSLAQETIPVTDGTEGEETRSMSDEYTLLIRGQTGSPVAGRARPRPEHYLFRGSEGMALDDSASNQSSPSSSSTYAQARASLPSPIIGALPTYDLTSSGIARVSHVLRYTFFYSILGQGRQGETLPLKDGEIQEGSIRCWNFEREIIVASDTSISGQQGPPGYAACSCSIGLEPNDTLPLFPSVAVDRTTSIMYGTSKWPSHVSMNQKELRKRTMEHFEETEGLCECFADRAAYQPDLGKEMEERRYQMEVVSVKV